MHAATAQNNRFALEASYVELLAVIDADQGPDTTSYLNPATIEHHEEQTRKRQRQAG